MSIFVEFKKEIIKLQTCLIKNKTTRQQTRKEKIDKLIEQEVKNTKWGVSYSVYDGEELLEASIKSIKNCVDYVGVVYQTKSWYGEDADKNLLPLLLDLKNQGLIDELIEYKPNFKKNAGKNERTKRTLGIKHARKAKVDYLICMDTDEFFIKEEIESAKTEIISKGITHSFCPIVNYTEDFTERLLEIRSFAIPLFSKINIFSKAGKNYKHAITITDPNRTISHRIFSKYFFLCSVRMHHFTHIRKDIEKKLRSSSCKDAIKNFKLYKKITEKTYKSEDIFNIESNLNTYYSKYPNNTKEK